MTDSSRMSNNNKIIPNRLYVDITIQRESKADYHMYEVKSILCHLEIISGGIELVWPSSWHDRASESGQISGSLVQMSLNRCVRDWANDNKLKITITIIKEIILPPLHFISSKNKHLDIIFSTPAYLIVFMFHTIRTACFDWGKTHRSPESLTANHYQRWGT